MISIFDLFKIGIGPSSSHTVGPMKAGKLFADALKNQHLLARTCHIRADIYGSLSMTGRGHNTDTAIIMGLGGYCPEDVAIDLIPEFVAQVKESDLLPVALGEKSVRFVYHEDMVFHRYFLPLHENGMTLSAFDGDEQLLLQQTYYSVGGGFIVDEHYFQQKEKTPPPVPFPYQNAAEMLKHCQETALSPCSIMKKNEIALHGQPALQAHLRRIWQTMSDCIARGVIAEGALPGPLKLPRRAATLRRRLETGQNNHDPMQIIDWINLFALAVNEENAAGGRVVTAPTNGACGIVPAVFAYYDKFIARAGDESIERYFLTTAFIASLYKMNASISGAEVGCQGEVGVACSMAAAGLAELLGGSAEQVCTAAEIAMEHNLGLTCDPVNGQVQVPCIERNAIAAVKAVNAARMALMRTTAGKVSLDKVIESMYETGKDMHAKYRETSLGGLALKVPCQ